MFSTAERQYVWGDRYVDDLVLRDRDTDANGSLDERLYAMQDPNWNVVAVANTTGDVQERYTYSAYGVPTVLTPVFGSRGSTSFAWDQLYTGRSQDCETGLYYYRNRYYSADLGRFLTRDPIEYWAGDLNLYRYVFNGPLTYIDAMGLEGGYWGQGGWWWLNPWSYTFVPVFVDPHMLVNLPAGNTDWQFWNMDAHIKDQERRLWERLREHPDRNPELYAIYYRRYYQHPVPPSHGDAIRNLEQLPPNFPSPTPCR